MRPQSFKFVFIGVIVCSLIAVVFFDVKQYISVDQIRFWYASKPLQVSVVFTLLYLFIASFSLPGVGPLMFVAGALFGVWQGVVIVSFASAIGATIGMLISRLVLRDWVQKRFTKFVNKMNQGIVDEGALYLFGLRLIPPMPFFIVNLAFGLTQMPISRFYIVTQLGMLPLVFVYVNAGSSIGSIESMTLANIFTVNVIVSFVLLISFPILMKLVMAGVRQRMQRNSSL